MEGLAIILFFVVKAAVKSAINEKFEGKNNTKSGGFGILLFHKYSALKKLHIGKLSGTVDIFENKLYIQTGKVKEVSKQIKINPKVEICGMLDGKWIRVEAIVVEDDRVSARQHMLDAYPSLKALYSADDGNTEVLYLKNATATISSFTEEPRVIKF